MDPGAIVGNGSSAGLERKLGLFPLTNVVIANMIGAGIFTTSGLLMNDLGDPLLLLSLWVVGGIIALCGALSYGMLGAAIPHSGGEYAFLSRMYHPLLGFLGGWTSFIVGFSAPIAASAIGFSEYFLRAFPQLAFRGDPSLLKKILSIGGLAMGKHFGRSLETVFSLLVSFALFSSLSAFILLGPRVYHSMAKDRLFFRGLAHVDPGSNVPSRSIALQGAISSVMVLSGTFDQILTVMGFALGIFPLFAVAGVLRLKSPGTAGEKPSWYPWAPIVYLASGSCILLLSFFHRPAESSLAILSVLVGVPVYAWFKRKMDG